VVLRQQESIVKLATAGWKRYERRDIDTGVVDLGHVATWKVDLGTKKVGHRWRRGILAAARQRRHAA